MAKSVAYPLSPDAALQKNHWTVRAVPATVENFKELAKSEKLSIGDLEIVAALNEASSDMAYIHSCFDYITDELLIDCLIYELKAVSLRHKYFLNLCKEKGIVCGNPTGR